MIEKRGRNNDPMNRRWKLEEIAKAYLYENPHLTIEECREKAKPIFRELRRLDKKLSYNNDKYYSRHIPFSTFENEKGEYCFFKTKKTEDDYT